MVLVSIRHSFLKRGSGVVGSLSEAMGCREREFVREQPDTSPFNLSIWNLPSIISFTRWYGAHSVILQSKRQMK
jgi:hypothetical protein